MGPLMLSMCLHNPALDYYWTRSRNIPYNFDRLPQGEAKWSTMQGTIVYSSKFHSVFYHCISWNVLVFLVFFL